MAAEKDIRVMINFHKNQCIPVTTCNKNHLSKKVVPLTYTLKKINNRNTRKSYEMYSKSTIKTPKRRDWRRYERVVGARVCGFSGWLGSKSWVGRVGPLVL